MACINVPTIVAEGSFLSQTANLESTEIYNIVTAGIYRVTMIISPASGSVDGVNYSIYGSLSWTSDAGSESNSNFYSAPIYCVSSSSISIAATLGSAGTPAFLYNLYYVVEAL